MAAWENAPTVEKRPIWETLAPVEAGPAWEKAPVSEKKGLIESTGENPLNPLSYVVGAGEVAAQMGTGLFGALAGTAAGTYESVRDMDPGKFAPAFEREAEPVTYQPRSASGKSLSELLSMPFTAAEKGGKTAGEYTFEKTGSPLAATAVQTGITAIPYVATLGLGRAARRPEKVSPSESAGLTKPEAPDVAVLQQAREKMAADTVRESSLPDMEVAIRDQLRSQSQETLDKVQRFLETDLSKVEIPKPGTDPKLNYANYLVTTDDAKRALLATQDLTRLTHGKKTLAQVEAEALSEGKTTADLLKANGPASAADIMTYKSVVAAAGRNTLALRDKARTGTEAEKALFATQFEETMALLDQFDGVKSEWGRSGRVLREPVSDEIARLNAVRKLNEKTYQGHSINDLINLTDGMATPELIEFAAKARRAKTSEQFLEAWKAGLLTGLRTHEANLSSNLIAQGFNLQEHAVAAGLGKALPREIAGDKVFFREIPAQASGMIGGAMDGAKLALETLRKGETAAEASKALDLTTRYQAIPGKLGTVVRTPYRVLAAEDKLFKEMARQANLHTLAAREAARTTKTTAEFRTAYDKLLKNPTKEMTKASDDMAAYLTFNKELGKTGKAISGAIASHPAFSVIVPFVRTPTNVVKFFGERTPLAVFSQKVRAEFAKGGAARDLAAAKIIVGSAWAYAGYQMAESGAITGGGPVDPGKRSVWLNTHKPYSAKNPITGEWHSYNRYEPVGTFFGAAADLSEVWKAAGTEERDRLVAMMTAAISRNLTNKTMVAGISSAILAQTDPSRYGERFVNQLAGSVVPTLSAEITQARDPIYRQIDSTIDAIKARTPGLSETLYPKRDLYGQPIQRHGGGAEAFLVSPGQEVQTDLAYTELGRLGMSVSPPERKILGKEMDASVYDRYARDAGELAFKLNSRIVNHPGYLGAPPMMQKELLQQSFSEARAIARIYHGITKQRDEMSLERLKEGMK